MKMKTDLVRCEPCIKSLTMRQDGTAKHLANRFFYNGNHDLVAAT